VWVIAVLVIGRVMGGAGQSHSDLVRSVGVFGVSKLYFCFSVLQSIQKDTPTTSHPYSIFGLCLVNYIYKYAQILA